jgi:anti-anti-sigma factor
MPASGRTIPRFGGLLEGRNFVAEDTMTSDSDTQTAVNGEAGPNDENQEPRLVTHLRRPGGARGDGENENVVILDVSGEVDLATLPTFKQAILAALDQSQNKRVILNMTGVGYMDSSGFGTLLSANKGLRASGRAISLVGCNPVITRMIFITRLNTLFDLYDSEDEAHAATEATAPTGDEVPAPAL